MVKEILLKHLKVIAISTVFIAVGNSYAFHPDKALAKNNDSNSSTSEITTVSNTVSDKTRQKVLEDAKVEEVMDALEKERPIVEGATIIKYNYMEGNDYVKNGKYYKIYKVYWTKTDKVNFIGIPIRVATNAEAVLYSKSGNHVDSRAKLTAKQKKIINTLNQSEAYSAQFRYIVVYGSNAKRTKLYLIPKSENKAAISEIYNRTCYSFDSKNNIAIAKPTKKSPLKTKVKIGYSLNILPHVAKESEWYRAFTDDLRYFQGYTIGEKRHQIKELPAQFYKKYEVEPNKDVMNKKTKETAVLHKHLKDRKYIQIVNSSVSTKGDSLAFAYQKDSKGKVLYALVSVSNRAGSAKQYHDKNLHYGLSFDEGYFNKHTKECYAIAKDFGIPTSKSEFISYYKKSKKDKLTNNDYKKPYSIGSDGIGVTVEW